MKGPATLNSLEDLLPNCLIIGAAKAGTTSLFGVLVSHPQVFGSPVKETRFFSHDERFGHGLEWYGTEYFRWAGDRPVRIEASPAYLTWSDKVAPRIRQAYDGREIKLVAIFRDPTRRAYSHYWHHVRLGNERLPFDEALREEDNRLQHNWDDLFRTGNGRYGYFRAGCYATRLRPFLEHFDRKRLFFLLQEDLQPERFDAAVKRLLVFLEIDDAVTLRFQRINMPTKERFKGLARTHWRLKRTFLQRLYTNRVPLAVRERIRAAMFSPADYPPMDPELERSLRARYADEVKKCEELIQRDLSHWLPS